MGSQNGTNGTKSSEKTMSMAWEIVLREIQELIKQQGFIFRFVKHGIEIDREWENDYGRHKIQRCVLWSDFLESNISPAEMVRIVIHEMYEFQNKLDQNMKDREEKTALAAQEIMKRTIKPLKSSTEAGQ